MRIQRKLRRYNRAEGSPQRAAFCRAKNENMEVFIRDNIEAKMKGKMVPIWEKYMLTVDEAVQYFGIGEKKIRMLISENTDTDYCFTVSAK